MTIRTLDRVAAIPVIPLTLIGLGIAVLLPFIAHLIPPINGTPIGSWLLPIFYAPLLAIMLLHRPVSGMVVALLAPITNHLLLNMPTLPIAAILTIELVTFCVLLTVLLKRWRGFWGAVLIAYLFAKSASLVVLFIYPIIPADPFTYTVSSTATALPGVAVMLVMSYAVMRASSDG